MLDFSKLNTGNTIDTIINPRDLFGALPNKKGYSYERASQSEVWKQWYEKRRTGYPVLPNNGGLLNDGKMPQRLMYPTQPKILNAENYQAAVQSIGGDNINVINWWNQ